MATIWSEDGSKKVTKNTNRGHVALQGVPLWPEHKRPDRNRDKYGPLPNPNIPKSTG